MIFCYNIHGDVEMEIHLHKDPFDLIKSGKKDIELRVNDEKRQSIKVGDTIKFICRLDNEVFYAEVINKYYYKDFKEVYDHIAPERMNFFKEGMSTYKDLEQFYSQDEIDKYGVVALELKIKKEV